MILKDKAFYHSLQNFYQDILPRPEVKGVEVIDQLMT